MSNIQIELSKIATDLPWYERAIAAVSPEAGNRRLTARLQRHLFAYQGGRADRLYKPKTTGVPAESYQTARDRITMMWESLDLVENFPLAKAATSKFATFLTPTEYAPSTGSRDYDTQIAEYVHDWCKRCDITGRNSFRKMVQIAASMRPAYGDCGFIMRRKAGDLKLQLVSGDRIGNPNEAVGTYPNYFSGVVVDEYGAPTAYRIFRVDQAGQYLDPEEVPADKFFHYYDPFRADQYRGVTDFHAVLRTSRMLKEILDAEMTGVRFSSQQAALVFTERGQAPARNLFTPTNAPVMANGEQPKQEESSIGTIRYLYNGDKVETMPARPSSAFTGFVDELKQDIALGLGGYPGGVLWGTADYKGPSVRAEFAQADRVNQYHQGILEDKVLRPIVSAVILHGISNGAIDAPKRSAGESMDRAIMRATRGSWRFPPRLTIDVGRETQSRLAELSMGATSPQEIASEDGKDAYVRAEEKADFAAFVQELAKTRGVPESSIFLPAGQTLPNNPAQAASVGTQTGKDASEAEAAKIASPEPEILEDSVEQIDEQLEQDDRVVISFENGGYVPTTAMASNAERALEVRRNKPQSQRGMTAVGLARARDISNRRELSIETVKRMKAYFDRHEVDKEGSTWEEQGKGWQAWNGWGGDAGRTWAEKIVSREESKTEAETKQQSMELAGMEVVQWLSRPEAKPVENGISDPTVRNAFAGYEDAVGRYRKQLYDRLEFELNSEKN
jgi:capsid protein